MSTLIPVGISSCLMGESVRYNGGHKRSRLCLEQLAKVFDYRPFCPEVAIGMGVPREPIRLVGSKAAPRAVGLKHPEMDVSAPLLESGRNWAQQNADLCGYVLMQKSPSCGLNSTKIYRGDAPLPGGHAGMFVRGLVEANPLLPVEEEGRLHDAVLRENFVARVFAYSDWHQHVQPNPTPSALVEFHSRYKFMAMAHGQEAYRDLGRLVADAGIKDGVDRYADYFSRLMRFLKRPASRKGHVNTLFHLLGFLREFVQPAARQEIVKVIDAYRRGTVNLSVPAALLNHYVSLHGDDYLRKQVYLRPYSEELGLRNEI